MLSLKSPARPTPNYYDWKRSPKGWEVVNAVTPVPEGRWCKAERFAHRDPSNGRVIICIDGEPLFDVSGVRTMNDNPNVMMTLSDIDASDVTFPMTIEVDDVEVWSR